MGMGQGRPCVEFLSKSAIRGAHQTLSRRRSPREARRAQLCTDAGRAVCPPFSTIHADGGLLM
eukprot:scaffold121362_cov18-Tisochrysis_lutea.AAC.1